MHQRARLLDRLRQAIFGLLLGHGSIGAAAVPEKRFLGEHLPGEFRHENARAGVAAVVLVCADLPQVGARLPQPFPGQGRQPD